MKTDLKRSKRRHDPSYTKLKVEYESEILRAKNKCAEQFISNVSSLNDGHIRYKLFCKDKKSNDSFPSLKKSDGKMTTSERESAQLLADTTLLAKKNTPKRFLQLHEKFSSYNDETLQK